MGEFKSKAEQAIQAGEQFCDLYYDIFDNKRHQISRLYTASSVLIWNGNPNHGETKIIEFVTNLPNTKHIIQSLDCQPILDVVTPNQTTILVTAEGTVSFGDGRPEYFNQNFMLTALDNVWKIASDCFRYIDR
ncbi:NTF2-related export protein 2-like [Rhopilema esculentum]|uniref:NTF2-related export protein 2-like n=1 Tax=Rhopilema esculentum TaxID=499914 RepID=UPI0031DBAD61